MTTAHASLISEVTLHCTEGGCDKLYRVSITEEGSDAYSVQAASCRRGNPWVLQGIKAQCVPLAHAEKKAESIIKSKKSGGYRVIEEGLGVTSRSHLVSADDEAVDLGIRPQLLNAIEEVHAKALLANPSWIAQEKMDGVRLMLLCRDGVLIGLNKKGKPVAVDSAVAKALSGYPYDFLLDGEMVGTTYYAFDLLEVAGHDVRHRGFKDRYKGLIVVLDRAQRASGLGRSSPVRAVPFATNMEALHAAGAEGIVFKRSNAPHHPGRPASGGDQLKFKFVATASFIVTAVTSGKRSVALGLYDGGAIVPVGNVAIPSNQAIPKPGAIVEVRYLYAFPNGGHVFQPVYLGVRDDVDGAECLLSQLKFKTVADSDDE